MILIYVKLTSLSTTKFRSKRNNNTEITTTYWEPIIDQRKCKHRLYLRLELGMMSYDACQGNGEEESH